jgi:hypothetical protein
MTASIIEVDIAIAAATETTAHQQIVQLHLVSRNAKKLGRRLCSRGLALRTRPNLNGIATRSYRGNGVQRLHLRVIGIVATIFAFDHTRRILECTTCIACAWLGSALETDCVAGHVGLELRNVGASYAVEKARISEDQAELWPQRLFAFELRWWEDAARG